MQTQTFLLKNMDCDACERLVTMTLQDIPGVERVIANRQEVEVTYEEVKTTQSVIFEALNGIGHAA